MAAKQINTPCSIRVIQETIGGKERGHDCNSATSLYVVHKLDERIGTVCEDHITAAMEIEGLTHSFANWSAS